MGQRNPAPVDRWFSLFHDFMDGFQPSMASMVQDFAGPSHWWKSCFTIPQWEVQRPDFVEIGDDMMADWREPWDRYGTKVVEQHNIGEFAYVDT